jgi:hypothetical protein
MVFLRNISVDTLHKGDSENNNNNKFKIYSTLLSVRNLPINKVKKIG